LKKTLTLIKFLVKAMWNNFKIQIKKLITLLSVIVFSVAVIIYSQLIRFFLFETSPEIRESVLSVIVGETSSTVYDILFNLLSVTILMVLGLGLYRFSLAFMFDPVDLRILRPAPVRSLEMYLAKHVRALVKYTPIIILSFVVALPIMDYLQLTFAEKMLMFSIILIFFGLLKALENLTFFLTRTLLGTLKAKRIAVILILTVFLTIAFVLRGEVFHGMLVRALPSRLVTEIILASAASQQKLESFLTPFTALIIGYIGLLTLTLVVSEWYDKVAKYDEQRQPTLRRLLRGRSLWHLRFWHDPALTIALKDFWVNLRQDFLINVIATSGMLSIMMLLEFGSTQEFALLRLALDVPFIRALVIIFVFPLTALFSPSLESFTQEPGNIWILKTSPVPPAKIVYGKYLCALFISVFTVAPLLVYMGFLFLTPIIWTTPHVLLISNAAGIYIGARHPVTSREQSFSLVQILSSLVLTTALIAVVPLGISFSLRKPAQLIIALAIVTGYALLVSHTFLKLASNALKWNEKLL